jgi:glucose-6-phosphate isomerase
MEVEYDLTKITPDIRHLDDMRKVLYDEEFAKTAENADLYLMYRKLKHENELNYNITVTLAKMLGKEFNKTKGHVHIGNYGEIYSVIEGEAIFLMQKGDENKIEDVYAVKAKAGESAIIPGGYGHITINPLETQNLKTEDWSSDKCKSDYSMFERLQGGCYYYVKGPDSAEGFGEGIWIKNSHYKSVPELRFEESTKTFPQNLNFLKNG